MEKTDYQGKRAEKLSGKNGKDRLPRQKGETIKAK